MTINELNAALDIQRRINRLQASLDTLHETGGIGSAGSTEPVMGGVSRDTGQLAIELAEEIAALCKDKQRVQIVIKWELDKLELNDMHRKVLEARYIQGLSMKGVAIKIGYTIRHAKRYHKQAMAMLNLSPNVT